MKKTRTILIFICIALSLTLLSACNHEHTYRTETTTQATCTKEGTLTYLCDCGDVYTEEIPATGEHSWGTGEITISPTCGTDGEKTFTCAICSATKTESEPKTENHSWDDGEIKTEATCLEEGSFEYTCIVCGKTKTEGISKTDTHIWNDGVEAVSPTCGTAGEKHITCTICGFTKSEPIEETGKHDWNQGEITKEATCGAKGEKLFTCTACGKTKTEQISATNKHKWDDGEVTKESTCATKGTKTYTCTICKKTKTEDLPLSDEHTWEFDGYGGGYGGDHAQTLYWCNDCKTQMIEPITWAVTGKNILASGAISGTELFWSVTKYGELYIYGEGEMPFYYTRQFYHYEKGSSEAEIIETAATPWSTYYNDIKEVIIDDGCTLISTAAFMNFKNLAGIYIPNTVKQIGNDEESGYKLGLTFYGCDSLKSIIIPKSVKTIYKQTFQLCTALNKVTFEGDYNKLPNYLFIDCPNLEKIIFKGDIGYISDWAAECNIKEIYFYGDAPKLDKSASLSFLKDVTIYYVKGTSGWDADEWSGYNLKTFNP